MDVLNETLDLITEYVDIPREEIDITTGLKFAGLNSYAVFSLVGDIESHFGISIPDEDLKSFNTISDIVKFVEKSIA